MAVEFKLKISGQLQHFVIGIVPAIPIKRYKTKVRIRLSPWGANVSMFFAGRLVQEPSNRLNECALRFANHN